MKCFILTISVLMFIVFLQLKTASISAEKVRTTNNTDINDEEEPNYNPDEVPDPPVEPEPTKKRL